MSKMEMQGGRLNVKMTGNRKRDGGYQRNNFVGRRIRVRGNNKAVFPD